MSCGLRSRPARGVKGPATPARRGSHASGWVLAVVVVAAAVAPARADSARATPRWSIGILAGSVQPEADLADYQWSTTPRVAWGLQALAGAGRLSGGVRLWNTRAQQEIGAGAGSSMVRGTSFELVGRGRLLSVSGSELLAVASGGRLHLGYEPDRVEIASGAGDPIEVRLAPIDEWIVGAGVALERRIASTWRVGFEVERRLFKLDTAHRSGDAIVERRETLGDWNARVELARLGGSR